MAGKYNSNGQLSVLDLSEATAASADLIGDAVFAWCGKLTSISFPVGVTSIDVCAFTGCSNLTSVTIPDEVTSIGESAFYGCSNLTSVTIGKSVTSVGKSAFCACSKLTSVTIGKSVTSIGEEAFYSCSKLTSVTIPDGVTSIGKSAFWECSNLTSVTIGKSVTSIGESAFQECSNLTSITIPDEVTSIGELAFYNCSDLTSVTIGKSVTSIGEYAFGECNSLTEVVLQGNTLPTCGTRVFYKDSGGYSNSNATLYCYSTLAEKCRETEPWKNFKNITSKPFDLTISDAGIATGCFDDDLNFSNVTGLKAYIASGFDPETGKVLMTNVTKVPAGTGFIVKGTEGKYEIPAVATKCMYANMLVGTLKNTILQPTDEDTYTYYVLGKDAEDKAGFFLVKDDCEIPANKAYLQISTSAVATTTSNVMSSLSIGFDDEDGTITGVAPVKTVEEEDMDGNTVIYNINGQRMQSLTRGLNIVNGKKIFIK